MTGVQTCALPIFEALLGSLKAMYGPRRARWMLDEKEGMSRDTRELNRSYSACA